MRLSEGERYENDFSPPAAFDKEDGTLALLELARGSTRLRDLTGHGHDGVNVGGRWTGPLDPEDVRVALKALGANLGDAVVVESERGTASTDWWISERDWMSDGFIHEIWTDRDPDTLGHWAKVPFRVTKPGSYRVWFLGGNLERQVGEDPYDYSPFSWRIDDSPAQVVSGGAPTLAGTRIERGLSVLGIIDLTAGEHVFDLRLTARRTTDDHWSLWFDGLVLEHLE